MIQKPLVTIIVPAYNTEKYIDKCLQSLINQSYHEIEVIMIDDGSRDATNKICKKYEQKDIRFKLISKKNTGVSDSRNVGIHYAKGEFIIFVDSDDYVAKDYVATLVKETYETQLVCAEYFLVDGNQEKNHISISSGEKQIMSAVDAINMLQKQDAFQGYLWNKIFLRDVIINENIWFDSRIRVWEDMLFCLKYLTKIEYVCYIKKPIYYYVQRPSSAMHDNVWKENTQFVALDEMWKIVKTMEGPFHEYIKNYYANYLVGVLGKENFQDKNSIIQTLTIVNDMKAKLTFKHKVKIMVYRCKKIFLELLSK